MMLFLDTHTFLWWNLDAPQLSPRCRELIGDGGNDIYLSAASAWEIAIKAQLGILTLPDTPELYVPTRIASNRFHVLPILMEHALRTFALPVHHRDPFDRILVAQS